jgi:hypothetical protein
MVQFDLFLYKIKRVINIITFIPHGTRDAQDKFILYNLDGREKVLQDFQHALFGYIATGH